MKKRLTMAAAVLLIVCMCTLTAVIPASAKADINSRGDIIFEDSGVAIHTEDIETLQAQIQILSESLAESSYISEDKCTLKYSLNSVGAINFDSDRVVFDALDLYKLADWIDNINVGYKTKAEEYLNQIGTYHKADGSITHNPVEAVTSPEDVSMLSFSEICKGILKSQSVEHLSDENILPAVDDNLSEGSAAWVNGTLLIGNGNDNKKSYELGYEEGHSKGYEEGEASKPTVGCYFLGTSNEYTEDDEMYYNIASQVPEVDYTKLTAENFIVAPYLVYHRYKSKMVYPGLAGADAILFAETDECDMVPSVTYNSETGQLYVKKSGITIRGGMLNVFDVSTDVPFEAAVYMIVGEIADYGLSDESDTDASNSVEADSDVSDSVEAGSGA